jgi:hypothetical protein
MSDAELIQAEARIAVEGLTEIQERMANRIAALQPGGALEASVQEMILSAHKYAVSITHIGQYKRGGGIVRGGFLKASHLIRLEAAGRRGVIYINPEALNTIQKKRPADYGVFEHRRGGDHAFYERTRKEALPGIYAEQRRKLAEVLVDGKPGFRSSISGK